MCIQMIVLRSALPNDALRAKCFCLRKVASVVGQQGKLIADLPARLLPMLQKQLFHGISVRKAEQLAGEGSLLQCKPTVHIFCANK